MARTATEEAELERLLASPAGKEIQAEIDKLATAYQEDAQKSFDLALANQNEHDTLIDICASAFGPTSEAYTTLGYAFLTAEPLQELGIKNFDLLIYNPKRKVGIFVECKGSISDPSSVLDDIYEKVHNVQANKAYLEKAIGDTLDRIEYVICLPSETLERVLREIERREGAAGHDLPPVLLWHVNKFRDQALSLWGSIKTRNPERLAKHGEPALSNLLGNGVRLGASEVVVPGYPSSHPQRLAVSALQDVLQRNAFLSRPMQEIPVQEVEDFFKKHFAHYAPGKVSKKAAERFIKEGKEFGLLADVEGKPGVVKLKAEGRTLKTLVDKYKRAYREAASTSIAERRAAKDALKNYRKRQPRVDSFEQLHP